MQPKTFFDDNIVPLQRELQILVGLESEMVGESGGYLYHPKTSFEIIAYNNLEFLCTSK
jgi:hypothetical protein